MFGTLLGAGIGLGIWYVAGKVAGSAIYHAKKRRDEFGEFWNAEVDYSNEIVLPPVTLSQVEPVDESPEVAEIIDPEWDAFWKANGGKS